MGTESRNICGTKKLSTGNITWPEEEKLALGLEADRGVSCICGCGEGVST